VAFRAAGQNDEARKWIDKVNAVGESPLAESPARNEPLSWNRRLTLELIRRELDSKVE
jgi:hypothetical protein